MATMTGSKALMELLRLEGVAYVFGLPGSSELEFMDALEDTPDIRYILSLQESIVVAMAEGYSRTSGKVGVCNLHTCAGLSSAMGMLLNAHIGRVPLLITAGQQDTRLLLQEPLLSGDLVGIASHFTKWSTEVAYAEDIPVALRRAFKVATQPPTGPVFVSLPMNVMKNSLDFEYTPGASLPNKVHPDREAVATAVRLLAQARTPLIVVGQGVTRNQALDEAVKLAELTGARVYQLWMGDVNFPTDHPQYLGELNAASPASREIMQSVDVLVAIGDAPISTALYMPEPIISASTRIIHIDDNPWEIGKNFPVAAGITGHIKVSLAELNEGLQASMKKEAQEAAIDRATAVAREAEKINREFLEKAREEKDQVPIAVSRLSQEIRDALKPDTIVVDDSISAGPVLRRTLRSHEPLSYINARGGGSIGWGIPAAIGAKLAAPERPVIATVGDGSAIWSIQSLWTAAHYHIPVTFIVFANGTYNMVKIMKHLTMGERARGRYLGMDIDEPRMDFCRMAQALGIAGQRVERPEELGDALKSALESGEPNLVEVSLAGSF